MASIDEGSVAVKSGRRVTFAGGVMGNDDDEDDETANRDKRFVLINDRRKFARFYRHIRTHGVLVSYRLFLVYPILIASLCSLPV